MCVVSCPSWACHDSWRTRSLIDVSWLSIDSDMCAATTIRSNRNPDRATIYVVHVPQEVGGIK